jgi:hypothetical protein
MDASDQHAEVAVLALSAALVLGAVALAGIFISRKRRQLPRWLTALILFLALITTAVMVWTASLGGKIRHPEVLQVEPSRGPRALKFGHSQVSLARTSALADREFA